MPADRPLLTFHTRQVAMRAGRGPEILTINGEEPSAFAVEGATPPRFPFLDFSTIRVLFSEPIDVTTVVYGDTFELVEVGTETPVAGTLAVQGIHLTFDPDDDLDPDASYEMRLSGAIRDRGGEVLAARVFQFSPRSSLTDGALIEQVLNAQPAEGDPDFPAEDSLAGATPNAIDMSYPLVGSNTIFLKDGNVASHMGNPAAFEDFGGLVPIAIRKGQLLHTTGLDVALGGVIPTGLSTGELTVSFISDASGYMTRNPFRDPALNPDDATAPLYVFLTLDVAVSAADPTGNATLNQTIMNVQATGVAQVQGDALAIDSVGTMEFNLLGVARAPSNMVMRLATDLEAQVPTDSQAPALLATYPAADSDGFSVAESVVLTFSEPLDIRALATDNLLTRQSDGEAVPVMTMTSGSALVITPMAPLDYGETYTVAAGEALADLWNNAVAWAPGDPTGGTGSFSFRTPVLGTDDPAPVVLTALYPGVACALVDGDADSPGRCAGGLPDDIRYRPFEIPVGREIEAVFNQPVEPASMALGPLCGLGSIRVEIVDDNGACVAPLPGTLERSEHGFRFVPAEPWTEGESYRLTVVGGPDTLCHIGEVCGVNGKPLNTDPLNGTRGHVDPNLDTGGGPDLVIPFTVTPATVAAYAASAIAAPTDVNGNGFVDPGEIARAESGAASAIIDYGGMITDAVLDQEDCDPEMAGDQACLYVSGTMPVSIGGGEADCQIDGETVDWCVRAEVFPQIMYGTSLTMDATAVVDGVTLTMDNLPTRQLVMRVQPNPDGPVYGYLVAGGNGPRFRATLPLYMDAPDMVLTQFNMSHDLRSKVIIASVEGPVTFTADGRMQIDAANTEALLVQVNLSHNALPDNGYVTMEIPAGGMKLRLLTRIPQAGLVRQQLGL